MRHAYTLFILIGRQIGREADKFDVADCDNDDGVGVERHSWISPLKLCQPIKPVQLPDTWVLLRNINPAQAPKRAGEAFKSGKEWLRNFEKKF